MSEVKSFIKIITKKDIIIPKELELTLEEMHFIIRLLSIDDLFEYFDMVERFERKK